MLSNTFRLIIDKAVKLVNDRKMKYSRGLLKPRGKLIFLEYVSTLRARMSHSMDAMTNKLMASGLDSKTPGEKKSLSLCNS